MPSTYAHNAIGGETEETKVRKTSEKVNETADRKEKVGKTTYRKKERGKTTYRQVKERTRLEMFLRYRLDLLILAQ